MFYCVDQSTTFNQSSVSDTLPIYGQECSYTISWLANWVAYHHRPAAFHLLIVSAERKVAGFNQLDGVEIWI